MTVQELIESLQRYDPKTKVMIRSDKNQKIFRGIAMITSRDLKMSSMSKTYDRCVTLQTQI